MERPGLLPARAEGCCRAARCRARCRACRGAGRCAGWCARRRGARPSGARSCRARSCRAGLCRAGPCRGSSGARRVQAAHEVDRAGRTGAASPGRVGGAQRRRCADRPAQRARTGAGTGRGSCGPPRAEGRDAGVTGSSGPGGAARRPGTGCRCAGRGATAPCTTRTCTTRTCTTRTCATSICATSHTRTRPTGRCPRAGAAGHRARPANGTGDGRGGAGGRGRECPAPGEVAGVLPPRRPGRGGPPAGATSGGRGRAGHLRGTGAGTGCLRPRTGPRSLPRGRRRCCGRRRWRRGAPPTVLRRDHASRGRDLGGQAHRHDLGSQRRGRGARAVRLLVRDPLDGAAQRARWQVPDRRRRGEVRAPPAWRPDGAHDARTGRRRPGRRPAGPHGHGGREGAPDHERPTGGRGEPAGPDGDRPEQGRPSSAARRSRPTEALRGRATQHGASGAARRLDGRCRRRYVVVGPGGRRVVSHVAFLVSARKPLCATSRDSTSWASLSTLNSGPVHRTAKTSSNSQARSRSPV